MHYNFEHFVNVATPKNLGHIIYKLISLKLILQGLLNRSVYLIIFTIWVYASFHAIFKPGRGVSPLFLFEIFIRTVSSLKSTFVPFNDNFINIILDCKNGYAKFIRNPRVFSCSCNCNILILAISSKGVV